MPHKFNDARRDKFPKAKYRVTNCPEYNESLRRRGDVTIWVSDDVVKKWASPRRKTRGGQSRYSDLAIEICLTLRVVFRLPLRQTQGFVRSIAGLMGMDLVVPDYSTLSRRGKGLKITPNRSVSDKSITLILDSTGLKVHGGNGWHEEKHGTKKARKTWRKLHIGLDPETGDVVASKEFRRKSDLLTSVVGVGPKTAAACLAYVPELGSLTKGQAAAIVGLAPHAQDSGTLKGHRRISGGRREVRASLYMAALSALRYDPMMQAFARRLRERGKPAKVAITAIMRKLIVIMNAVLKTGEPARASVS
ncbi:IS5 family transposase [uncultured Tateyamaria sp.]|uniref:IS5 family transposase n=2 Tax=uncultured Tateyamaria sp. TaxID=455651 RepID=UPI0026266584|nr:IS5 family transposase [uncultured Tateyamaria sp.]